MADASASSAEQLMESKETSPRSWAMTSSFLIEKYCTTQQRSLVLETPFHSSTICENWFFQHCYELVSLDLHQYIFLSSLCILCSVAALASWWLSLGKFPVQVLLDGWLLKMLKITYSRVITLWLTTPLWKKMHSLVKNFWTALWPYQAVKMLEISYSRVITPQLATLAGRWSRALEGGGCKEAG